MLQVSFISLQGHCFSLKYFLVSTLKNVCFSTSQYIRESILNDIRKARNLYTGKELAAELARIRQRVDNIEVLTADIVINLLLSYRDIQVRRCSKSSLGCVSCWRNKGVLISSFS